MTSDQVVSGLNFGNSQNQPEPTDPGPVFQSSPGNDPTAQVGQVYAYTAFAADADHDQITYSLGLAPAGTIIDPVTGVIDWTPAATEVGFQNVDIQANDGNGNIATQYYSIAVSPADSPPVITTAALPTGYPDVSYSYQLTAVSPDNYYPVTFSLAAGDPSWLSISASGLLTWKSAPVLGTYPSVTINATDTHNGVGTKTFTLQVVSDPNGGTLTFTYAPPLTIQLGRTYVYNAVATDTAAYPLTYSLVSPYPSGMAFIGGTTDVSWVPTAAQLGNNPVTIKVSDGHESATLTFTVVVSEQGSDQPPTIIPPAPRVCGSRRPLFLRPAGHRSRQLPPDLVAERRARRHGARPQHQHGDLDAQLDAGGVADRDRRGARRPGRDRQQTYQVDVLAADLPPQISSEPPTLAGAGLAYAYQVQASDPDGSILTYSVDFIGNKEYNERMITYEALQTDRRQFLALTGLTLSEFQLLLTAFPRAYQQLYPANQTAEGQPRQRSVGGGCKGLLHRPEDKLLFILVYLKTYPLQAVMGELFDLSQPQVNYWIHRLLPVLQQALDDLGVRPERDGSHFAQGQAASGADPRLIIDGTERRRQRPKNPEKQALHYSGKKKTHTDKNVVIVTMPRETHRLPEPDLRRQDARQKDCRYGRNCLSAGGHLVQGYRIPRV